PEILGVGDVGDLERAVRVAAVVDLLPRGRGDQGHEEEGGQQGPPHRAPVSRISRSTISMLLARIGSRSPARRPPASAMSARPPPRPLTSGASALTMSPALSRGIRSLLTEVV